MIIFWSNNFNCFVFHCGKWIVIHLSCYLYFTFERFVTYEILFIIFINVKANVNIDKCALFLFLLFCYIFAQCVKINMYSIIYIPGMRIRFKKRKSINFISLCIFLIIEMNCYSFFFCCWLSIYTIELFVISENNII